MRWTTRFPSIWTAWQGRREAVTLMTEERSCALRGEAAAAESRRVCFVCTGNTCRSPMAAAVANALSQHQKEGFPEAVREAIILPLVAESAGLYPTVGEPIALHAVQALEEAGVKAVPFADYHNHTAQALTEERAESFDLLIGMSGGHTMELLMRFPALSKRIICMPAPISDPYGGDLAVYRACLAEITEGVQKLFFSEGQA